MFSQMKKSILVSAATAMLIINQGAMAATVTDTFAVTANIQGICTFAFSSTGDLAFGSYDPFSATSQLGSTDVHIRCTRGTTYQIGLNTGSNGAQGGSTTRSMIGATNGDYLNYEIYTDAARTTVWGNTPGVDTVDGTAADFSEMSFTAYGNIPVGQDKSVDDYADTITITVNY